MRGAVGVARGCCGGSFRAPGELQHRLKVPRPIPSDGRLTSSLDSCDASNRWPRSTSTGALPPLHLFPDERNSKLTLFPLVPSSSSERRHRPYSTVSAGSFAAGDIQWFPEGGLNVSYNCVDRWAYKHPKKVRPTSLSFRLLSARAPANLAFFHRPLLSGRLMSPESTSSSPMSNCCKRFARPPTSSSLTASRRATYVSLFSLSALRS